MQQLIPPVDLIKYKISQDFGVCFGETCTWYKDTLGIKGHNGIDIACPKGTEIKASHNGVIRTKICSDGNYLVYNENRSLCIKTMVCHLSKFLKNTGDAVKQGDVIGLSGGVKGDVGAGSLTTGAHLHFGAYQIDKEGNLLNFNNGFEGAVDPTGLIALHLKDFDLIKTPFEAKVYEIRNGYKWWIFDPDTFQKLLGKPVIGSGIIEVDFLTFNYYKYGGIIGKK